MRHRVHGRRLGRDSAHRKALRRNMIADLICHERLITTEAKARMLRPAAERVITLAKRGLAKEEPADVVHARRIVSSRMARKRVVEDEEGFRTEVDAIKKLFDEVAPRYMDRPGGYTRIIKMGHRPGDAAKMAMIMLVEED
ncbi:MAG TPA: 50S ribosomal protein L17 [Candidatus Sulfomarinibacteraceae bacterium]|nr:50S ribosomal protein L17 [Candidatus Sulfomarinibacteraceae bacterium]